MAATAGGAGAGWWRKKGRSKGKENESDRWDPVILFIAVLRGHNLIPLNPSNQTKKIGTDPTHPTKHEMG
jgi:hypothetical protein